MKIKDVATQSRATDADCLNVHQRTQAVDAYITPEVTFSPSITPFRLARSQLTLLGPPDLEADYWASWKDRELWGEYDDEEDHQEDHPDAWE